MGLLPLQGVSGRSLTEYSRNPSCPAVPRRGHEAGIFLQLRPFATKMKIRSLILRRVMFSESIMTDGSRLLEQLPALNQNQKKSPAFSKNPELMDTLFMYSKSSVGFTKSMKRYRYIIENSVKKNSHIPHFFKRSISKKKDHRN